MPAEFLEERLSDEVARGSRGGPSGKRTKVYAEGGQLAQVFRRTRPLQRYDVSFGVKTQEHFEAVRAMFYVVMFTPFSGFRYKDWNEHTVTRATSALVHISGNIWQLYRRYTVGSNSFNRIVQKPVDGTVVIYDAGGVALTATVDPTTGRATVTGTPATWAGEFDVPVTFVDDAIDNIDLDGIARKELQGLPSIKLEELLLPVS